MYRRRQWRIIAPFLLPSLVLYLLFVVYPGASAFWVSLHRWRGLRTITYVGLENFAKLPYDRGFRSSLQNNLVYTVVNTIATVALALSLAVVLTGRVRGAGFFRTLYFFPATISVVAIAAVWKMIYNPIWGPPAALFQQLGLDPPLFLGNRRLALPSVVAVVIWAAVGFHMTLYIAGIRSIPTDVNDAALVDGASSLQMFRHITVPLVWEVLRVSLVYLLIFGLNIFAIIRVMRAPGAGVLATYQYYWAFGRARYGYGSAIGVVLFFLTMAIALISLALTRRERVEYG